MARLGFVLAVSALCLVRVDASAQTDEAPLKVFGYFQTLFQHQTATAPHAQRLNSFSLQQLNLFLQKDLVKNWTAFVNVEGVNTFNSRHGWGSLRFEEAWARYRRGPGFNLKAGLQIPTFNNLNEIKNRTPVLPYIIRPLVYETSFEEFITVEEYLPTRAFGQVYGFLQSRALKLDYALFVGNTPNVNNDRSQGQTGIDTTTSVLVGGRVGIRQGGMKAGFSASWENTDFAEDLDLEGIFGGPSDRYEDIPRIRLGMDVSYDMGKVYLEGEWISVSYREKVRESNIDKDFYYGMVSYDATERMLVYASYWYTREVYGEFTDFDIRVPTAGVAFYLNDTITLKAQWAHAKLREELKVAYQEITPRVEKRKIDLYGAAISVFF